jgi:hypothetical protein
VPFDGLQDAPAFGVRGGIVVGPQEPETPDTLLVDESIERNGIERQHDGYSTSPADP